VLRDVEQLVANRLVVWVCAINLLEPKLVAVEDIFQASAVHDLDLIGREVGIE
jgi:hypothetical protein